MLSKRTTFILGAGASCDFGFPTGDGLQNRITSYLKTTNDSQPFRSDKVWNTLVPQFDHNCYRENIQRYVTAARRICDGMPVAASIDNFLHTNKNDSEIAYLGKIAISLAIIESEFQSPLSYVNRRNLLNSPLQTESYAGSWYSSFMKLLTMGTSSHNPEDMFRNARFIVFNYDRCLELILLYTIQGYYGLSSEEALLLLADVEIVHPYGSLGPLSGLGGPGVPFGHENADIATIASGIKTFTESVDEHIVQHARNMVAQSDTLVFLGFGFLPQNIDLLRPEQEIQANRIHATTFGVSSTDKLVIREHLHDFVCNPSEVGQFEFTSIRSTRACLVDVDNGTCSDLIHNHRMRLMA